MNLDRLLPKTSFGRFFLINVISLALFWLLIQPMANYWRNQALFRMVASNESRLFLTHIRLLDKLPTIAERNGLFNPNDDVFSIRVSHLPPDMPRDGSNCSQSLRRRLERAFKQENIRYTDLLTRIVVSHAPITVMGSEEKYSDLETFLTHHYMQAEIALRRPDGIWIYAKHQIEIMPQNLSLIHICGDETDADDLAVFLDGHKLAVGHVPGGPGGERIADFPFSRSHDAGDVAALHLAGFGPQGARNGPVGIDDADHPEAESVRIRFHGCGAFLHGDGCILDQRLLAHAFQQ